MVKEFCKRGKKRSAEGWVSLSLKEFGLGFSFHAHRRGFSRGFNLQINILFFEFFIDTWPRSEHTLTADVMENLLDLINNSPEAEMETRRGEWVGKITKEEQ